MGRGGMQGHGSIMGQGNAMGIKKMTDHLEQMNQMMETHNKMMQAMLDAHGAARPDKK